MKALHKLSHYITKGDNNALEIMLFIANEQMYIGMTRVLFLANVSYEELIEEKQKSLKIKFNTLNQLEQIVPIINEKMKEFDFGFPFYVIDEDCKRYFNE